MENHQLREKLSLDVKNHCLTLDYVVKIQRFGKYAVLPDAAPSNRSIQINFQTGRFRSIFKQVTSDKFVYWQRQD